MSQLEELNEQDRVKKKNSVSPYRIYGTLLIILTGFLALLANALKISYTNRWDVAILDVLVIFYLFAFFGFPMISRFCSQMKPVHLFVLMLSLAPFLVGHFSIVAREYFPAMSWFIFTVGPETRFVTCREMIGVRADGSEYRLLVEQIFPSIVQFDLPDDVNGKRAPNLANIITSVAEEYNRLHPTSPVVRVDLREFDVPVRPLSPQEKPTWIPLESYPVTSALSKS